MPAEALPKIDDVFFLVQIFCTFAMTGIVWFVQIVHYPLMRQVGKGRFVRYTRTHYVLTVFVVGPLMLLETVSVVFGLLHSTPWIRDDTAWLGAALLAVIWIVTIAIQLPQQRRLEKVFEARAYRRLLFGNWVRCYAWSFRSIILVFSMLHAFTR